jgi:hypothetical protein
LGLARATAMPCRKNKHLKEKQGVSLSEAPCFGASPWRCDPI